MASSAALVTEDVPIHPLTRYRQRHGLTLAAFAARVQPPTTQATISRIENGIMEPKFALLRRIVDATAGEVSSADIVDFHTQTRT